MNIGLAYTILDFADIVDEDEFINNNYETVAEFFERQGKRTITSQGRWDTHYREIYRDTRDNKFYEFTYSIGSTEYQNNGIENLCFFEVEPVEVTTIEYTRVKPLTEQ
jgi:hypothetical protein